MAIFGEGAAVLRIVPLIYFLLTLGICSLIIRRQFEKSSINLFLFFMVVPSAFSVIWTMKARGGFIEAVFLSLLYLLLLFENRRKHQRALVWTMGVLFGFCLYINALTLPFLLLTTIIYWLESDGRPRLPWRERWPILVFFLLGIFPLILHTIFNDVPPAASRLVASSPYGIGWPGLQKVQLLFFQVIPLAWGLLVGSPSWTAWGVPLEPSSWTSTKVAELFLLISNALAFIVVTYAYRFDYWDLIRLRRRKYSCECYLMTILPAFGFVLLVSMRFADIQGVRYLIFATVLMAFYQLELFKILNTRSSTLANSFAAIVLISGLFANQHFLRDTTDQNYSSTVEVLTDRGEDVRSVVRFLEENQLSYGYCSHWLQWKLIFLSRESLIYSAFSANRYRPYRERVDAQLGPTYIYRESKILDRNAQLIELEEKYNARYSVEQIDHYLIFFAG